MQAIFSSICVSTIRRCSAAKRAFASSSISPISSVVSS
jgi:hypothetical protein